MISEITPPVCASAYAAAGIAGANPFRTGINAFSLGIGKLMVPMVFVYAPTILIVIPEHFTIVSFLHVSITCAIGVFVIATAVSGYYRVPMGILSRTLTAITGLLLVAPSWESDVVAAVMLLPLAFHQFKQSQDVATTSY